jgi:6-pyruvoyltetrahydropterin/6-carboxytetrahydropterin synthase
MDIKHNTEQGSFTVGIDDESIKLAASIGIDAVAEINAALNKDAAEMRTQMPKVAKKFLSTKTYGNDRGLSCCFRQWRSTHSHCSMVHGYSIGVKFIFECDELDERNWVYDFGGLKDIKAWLEYMFDHTMLVAEDDPMLQFWKQTVADHPGTIDLRVVPGVGCERFAELIFDHVTKYLDEHRDTMLNKTARLKSVEVFEHGANSAVVERA